MPEQAMYTVGRTVGETSSLKFLHNKSHHTNGQTESKNRHETNIDVTQTRLKSQLTGKYAAKFLASLPQLSLNFITKI